MEEIKDLQKGITAILVEIGKIETEIRQLSNMSKKLDDTEKLSIQLEQSVNSAHKRIDGIEQAARASKDDKKWVIGAIIGAIALVINFMKL